MSKTELKSEFEEKYKGKLKSFTMFSKQLAPKNGEKFAEEIILGYVKAFHRSMGMPDDDITVKLGIITAIHDIKFDNDYIVFMKNESEEWLRVYAPC